MLPRDEVQVLPAQAEGVKGIQGSNQPRVRRVSTSARHPEGSDDIVDARRRHTISSLSDWPEYWTSEEFNDYLKKANSVWKESG